MSSPAPGRTASASVALSTASVYPESTATAFHLASRLGYPAVEVMVGMDETSQDMDAVARLQDHYAMPVVAVHAPCLLMTQRVWSSDPWVKLERSAELAHAVGCGVVVVHPPFRWQRDYAAGFADGIARLEAEQQVTYAVENMFPWRTGRRELQVYAPSWDPVDQPYEHVTLDLSHTATAGMDALHAVQRLGSRLAHVHLADGSGSARDEHLVPGRGSQPCGVLLELLADRRYAGHVVVEINTRREDRAAREAALVESLEFTRLHLSAAPAAR